MPYSDYYNLINDPLLLRLGEEMSKSITQQQLAEVNPSVTELAIKGVTPSVTELMLDSVSPSATERMVDIFSPATSPRVTELLLDATSPFAAAQRLADDAKYAAVHAIFTETRPINHRALDFGYDYPSHAEARSSGSPPAASSDSRRGECDKAARVR